MYNIVCASSGRCLIRSVVIASGPGAMPGGARFIALSYWIFVMYLSKVSCEHGFVCAGGGAMMKLTGF